MQIEEPFLNIVLYEPEIPYNTGNIGRLCVGLNARLHLIEPVGFKINDKMIRRAGLDYWDKLDYRMHSSWESFINSEGQPDLFFASTKAARSFYNVSYAKGDFILFGKESAGLPQAIRDAYSERGIRIPMSENIRSINLCNSVAIVMYEAYRQIFGN